MSVFYDEASLVLVPSGYKAEKVYAQKPLTTDGQLTFSRASTATRVNASGLIETVASGVPRLDYLGSTCPKLLLEPQRVNLALQSQTFDNAAWDKSDVTVTANTTVSPDGTQSADTIEATAADQRINQFVSVTASTVYTFSFYAKKGTMVTPRYSLYDLSNGAFVLTQVDYSSLINSSTWTRITVTFTTPAGCTSLGIYPINGASLGTIFLWGCQLEAGAYGTSYIPTTSAAVTRAGDAASKTGISSLMPSTEGTFFVDSYIDFAANATILASISNSSSAGFNNTVYWYIINNKLEATLFNTPTFTGWSAQTATLTNGRYKVAIAWKANDYAFYLNGSLVASSTSFSSVPSGLNNIDLANYTGSYPSDQEFNQVLLFKTRLTNDQLAQLTAV